MVVHYIFHNHDTMRIPKFQSGSLLLPPLDYNKLGISSNTATRDNTNTIPKNIDIKSENIRRFTISEKDRQKRQDYYTALTGSKEDKSGYVKGEMGTEAPLVDIEKPEVQARLKEFQKKWDIDISDPSVLERLATPMTQLTSLIKYNKLPNKVEMKHGERNPYDYALDSVNPASYVNYGKESVQSLIKGNYKEAGLNALGALPALGFADDAGRALSKAGNYATTKTPLKNAYKKINGAKATTLKNDEEFVTLFRVQDSKFKNISPEEYAKAQKMERQSHIFKAKKDKLLSKIGLKPKMDYDNYLEALSQHIPDPFEKYYGGWYHSDKDFLINNYANNKSGGFSRFSNNYDILEQKIPKSQLENYRVKNLIKDDPDLKWMSKDHNNEFIIPYEMRKNSNTIASNKFKSEIDWSKWNKEIPQNQAFIQEYNAIEQQAKANGTWMKNSDGTPFEGLPEQFVQINSSNFKNSFPKGYDKLFRGKFDNNPMLRNVYGENTSVFFADSPDLAKNYSGSLERFSSHNRKMDPKTGKVVDDKSGGMYEVAAPKSNKEARIYGNESNWSDIQLSDADNVVKRQVYNIKATEDRLATIKSWDKDEISKKFAIDEDIDGTDFFNNHDPIQAHHNLVKSVEEDLLKKKINFKKYIKNQSKYLSKDEVNKLFPKTTTQKMSIVTDDFASELEHTPGVDRIRIDDLYDGGFGNVVIHKQKSGQFAKSLFGNNGMFDMTDPNIYKSLFVPAIGAGLLYNNNK